MSVGDGVGVELGDEVRVQSMVSGSPPAARASIPPPGLASAKLPAAASPPAQSVGRLTKKWIVLAAALIVAGVTAALVISHSSQSSAELAIARAINLKAGDVPGFTVEVSQPNAAGKELAARAQNCPGAQGLGQHKGEVNASSPQFQSGPWQIGSEVAIERSSGTVASDFALLRSGQVHSCLKQVFDGLTIPASNGLVVKVSAVKVTSLAPPVTSASDRAGLRIAMTLSALGRAAPFTMDVLGFGVGRDEVSLTTFAVGQPFPAQTEQSLSALLVSRALARPH